MNIAFDLRSLSSNIFSGVQGYTINLLQNLLQLDQKNRYILFTSGAKNKLTPYLNGFLKFPNTELKEILLPNKFLNLSLAFLKYPKLDKLIKKADLFFFPNLTFNALSKETPYIIVFHDLSFAIDPSFFSLKMRAWHKVINPKKIAQKAKKIIAVSQNTKRDLKKFYRLQNSKIQVVYPGVKNTDPPINTNLQSAIEKKYNLPANYILYLGTLEPRKNIIGIIQAFEILKNTLARQAEETPLALVIAGQCGWQCKKIYQTARKSKFTQDIVFTGFIAEEDKAYLYKQAQAFIYPSFYEGFGFPPLEALYYNKPVVVSYNSSLPEIVGNQAILVDPHNTQEIAEGIKMTLCINKQKNFLENNRIKKYSWQKCAQQILQIIETV